MSNPITIIDGVFYRQEDQKKVGELKDGKPKASHYKFKHYLPDMEDLLIQTTINPQDTVEEEIEEVSVGFANPEQGNDEPEQHPRWKHLTPAVIEWRKQNWNKEDFEKVYSVHNVKYSMRYTIKPQTGFLRNEEGDATGGGAEVTQSSTSTDKSSAEGRCFFGSILRCIRDLRS